MFRGPEIFRPENNNNFNSSGCQEGFNGPSQDGFSAESSPLFCRARSGARSTSGGDNDG
jgi:hypothetical protein